MHQASVTTSIIILLPNKIVVYLCTTVQRIKLLRFNSQHTIMIDLCIKPQCINKAWWQNHDRFTHQASTDDGFMRQASVHTTIMTVALDYKVMHLALRNIIIDVCVKPWCINACASNRKIVIDLCAQPRCIQLSMHQSMVHNSIMHPWLAHKSVMNFPQQIMTGLCTISWFIYDGVFQTNSWYIFSHQGCA